MQACRETQELLNRFLLSAFPSFSHANAQSAGDLLDYYSVSCIDYTFGLKKRSDQFPILP